MTTTALTAAAAPAGRARRTTGATAPPSRSDATRPGRSRRPAPAHAVAQHARQAQPHHWFADRLLEVLSGQRPITRMIGHICGESTYDRLWELAVQGVLRPTRGRPTPQVRRCGFRAPVPGVREAYALIGSGDRLRALAFRLEYGTDHRWRCAAVETAGPPL